MKVQLVKGETKATFGKGSAFEFDYFHRPLTVEEKYRVRTHIVWGKPTKAKTREPDWGKFDALELIRLAVTRIERLNDSDDTKIGSIEDFLSSTFEASIIDGAITAMWIEVFIAMELPEELKKKLSPDSAPTVAE
jgi:hypothetical protein